ncbi:MAG TPA: ATP-binding protein, partial [Kofleriaceae bacterium]|nr:ATP-binding protein [Kofleriaceae bacterium]
MDEVTTDVDRVLGGGGEAGALARSIDWSRTAIGPVETWSQALRSTAALVLHNHSGLLLWWGPSFIQIYNDAYRPVLGDKHPRAMGQPVSECWSEIWHIIGPMIDSPFRGGPASTSDDLLLPLRRKHFLEEAHFRVAYSPVPDESVASRIGGVLATVTETTEQMYGERQLRTLRELGARSASEATTTTAAQACAVAAATLAHNAWDVPFALFYLLDDTGERARLVANVGFDPARLSQAAPGEVDLADGACAWPVRDVASQRRIQVIDDLAGCRDALPASPWGQQPVQAIALPLASPDQAHAYGVLICGVSPHRQLDTGYRTFFELTAGQVVTAIRNARALQVERKRAEALAEIDRAKTVFFSNISHEFRTPLTLMLGPTEDALGDPGRALRGEALETVYRNELRLLKLVNALLDFSRIEAGRMQAVYAPTDITARTLELASVFRSAIERAGLAYRVECAPIDAPIFLDVDLWEKIVLNLLSNALKFTLRGEICVRLEDRDADALLIVQDTGVGVPAAELPRLFERFHRIAGTAARTHEGSGIGLALVNDLVRLHGGTVTATSKLGVGTTFTVRIPKGSGHLDPRHIGTAAVRSAASGITDAFVHEAMRWLPAGGPAAASAERSPAPGTTRGRVVVADDNADMRDYVTRLLQPTWAVEAVGDGEAALALVLKDPPDLVLTDVMMPGLDGFGLLAELRRHPATRAIPVVMLSARAGEESRVEGLEAGADDYLVKPFSARELIARVGSQIELARTRQHLARQQRDMHTLADASAILAGSLDFETTLASVAQLAVPAIADWCVVHIAPDVVPGRAPVIAHADPARVELAREYLRRYPPDPEDAAIAAVLHDGATTRMERIPRERIARRAADERALLEQLGIASCVIVPMASRGRVLGALALVSGEGRPPIDDHDVQMAEELGRRAGLAVDNALLYRDARAADRRKDEFLAMLSHELRNPLAPILTILNLIEQRGTIDARDREILDRQVRHLMRLVDDLLDISRIARGKIDLDRKPLLIAAALDQAVDMARPLLEGKQIALAYERPSDDLVVTGDLVRLAQVFGNVLANAAHYTQAGGHVTVRARRSGGTVSVAISDDGAGIAPE